MPAYGIKCPIYLDYGQYSEVKTRELHIAPRVENFTGKLIDYISSVCKTAKKNQYETARVVFKTESKNIKTAYFETDGAVPLQDRYIRREILNFDEDLPSSLAKINGTVVGKMRMLK